MARDIEGKNPTRRYWGKMGALIKKGVPKDEAMRRARGYAGGKMTTKPPEEPQNLDDEQRGIMLPYASPDELPPEIREALPPEARDIFIEAFNSAWESEGGDEEAAMRIAWEAVNRAGFKKTEEGRWVKASEDIAYRGLIRLADFVSAEVLEAERPVSDIQIARTGTWEHPQYGRLEITEQTLQDFVDNFYRHVRGIDIAVDQAHRPEDGAAGWIKALHKRGNELWATVEWTPLGVRLIRDGIYRYFSPEFAVTYTDPETGQKYRNVLLGGGLTNRPFIKGMAPVMLSEDMTEAFLRVEPEAFKPVLPDKDKSNPEKEVETMKVKLSEAVQKALGLPQEVTSEELNAALEKKLAGEVKLSEDVKRVMAENQALSEANRQLSERVASLEQNLKKVEWEKYRDAKIREGKLTPALAEKFEALYFSEPERAKEIIEAMPPVIELGERGTSKAEERSEDTPDVVFLSEVQKYQREKGITFSEAMLAVSREKPDLARQYHEYVRTQA